MIACRGESAWIYFSRERCLESKIRWRNSSGNSSDRIRAEPCSTSRWANSFPRLATHPCTSHGAFLSSYTESGSVAYPLGNYHTTSRSYLLVSLVSTSTCMVSSQRVSASRRQLVLPQEVLNVGEPTQVAVVFHNQLPFQQTLNFWPLSSHDGAKET